MDNVKVTLKQQKLLRKMIMNAITIARLRPVSAHFGINNFIKDYRTISIKVPRRSGTTTLLYDLVYALENGLLITPYLENQYKKNVGADLAIKFNNSRDFIAKHIVNKTPYSNSNLQVKYLFFDNIDIHQHIFDDMVAELYRRGIINDETIIINMN